MTSPVPVRYPLSIWDHVSSSKATTFQDVRLALAQEDSADAAQGAISPHKTVLTTFLTMGLDLEEHQYVWPLHSYGFS